MSANAPSCLKIVFHGNTRGVYSEYRSHLPFLSIIIQHPFSMKQLLFSIFTVAALFVACKEKQDPACPTINVELVPAVVQDSLAARYPGVTVETWYKVDAVGFCAKFPQPPNTIFAHFGTDGTFQEEEVRDANGKEVDGGNEQAEDQNEDNTCECR